MGSFEIALASVVCMLLLIYLGMHVAIVLALVSFIGVWIIRSFDAAVLHLWGAASQTLSDSVFAVVPLYVLMGSLAGVAGMGRDTYDLAQRLIGGIRGSLGIGNGGDEHGCEHLGFHVFLSCVWHGTSHGRH